MYIACLTLGLTNVLYNSIVFAKMTQDFFYMRRELIFKKVLYTSVVKFFFFLPTPPIKKVYESLNKTTTAPKKHIFLETSFF